MAWRRSPGVVYEVIDGQAVLLDQDGVELITLNTVGTLVWEELDGRGAPRSSPAALSTRFDGVSHAGPRAGDIETFLAELEASALVAPANGDA